MVVDWNWCGGDAAPDEGEVDAEAPVDAAAVDADEDAVGDRGPGGVARAAVEAGLGEEGCTWKLRKIPGGKRICHLVGSGGPEPLEDLGDVGLGGAVSHPGAGALQYCTLLIAGL